MLKLYKNDWQAVQIACKLNVILIIWLRTNIRLYLKIPEDVDLSPTPVVKYKLMCDFQFSASRAFVAIYDECKR
jgi:hypothetical protein